MSSREGAKPRTRVSGRLRPMSPNALELTIKIIGRGCSPRLPECTARAKSICSDDLTVQCQPLGDDAQILDFGHTFREVEVMIKMQQGPPKRFLGYIGKLDYVRRGDIKESTSDLYLFLSEMRWSRNTWRVLGIKKGTTAHTVRREMEEIVNELEDAGWEYSPSDTEEPEGQTSVAPIAEMKKTAIASNSLNIITEIGSPAKKQDLESPTMGR